MNCHKCTHEIKWHGRDGCRDACRCTQTPETIAYNAVAEEKKKALEFAGDLLEASDYLGGDINGGDFQDIAVKHGYLVETHPTEPCDTEGGCTCAELYFLPDFDTGEVTCYRLAKEQVKSA